MKRGAAYIRVSTDDQLEYSPESQLDTIREYAQRNHILLPEEFIFCEEEGVSGRKAEKRAAFMRMIGVAKTKPKPFDVILLWRYSRFARNRQDSVVYKSMLRKELGIEVISVNEPLPEDDKIAVLIEALIEAMDEYYSINLAEDVRRGMLKKVARGEAVSAPPFGYRMENKQFYPDPYTAPIVQKIFSDFLAGKSYRELAEELNAMGIRSRRGCRFESRGIEYILHNPVYAGKIRYHPNGHVARNFEQPGALLADGIHQPILSPELWESAQARLMELRQNPVKNIRRLASPPFALQGLCRCSCCGGLLTRTGKGLNCSRYAHGQCPQSHYITAERLLEVCIAQIDADFGQEVFTLAGHLPATAPDTAHLLQAQLAREEQRLQRAQSAYLNGVDTLEEYREQKREIVKVIDALQRQAASQSIAAAAIPSDRQPRQRVTSLLRDPARDETEKAALLRAFIDHVVFDRAEGMIQIFYYL